MDITLTKDAQVVLATVYKIYLERRKNGVPKSSAKTFDSGELRMKEFPSEIPADFNETIREMCKAFQCKQYINGGFVLSDAAIVYMENRFENGIKMF